MDCWAGACGTSLYLQEGYKTTGQLVNRDVIDLGQWKGGHRLSIKIPKPIRINMFLVKERTDPGTSQAKKA